MLARISVLCCMLLVSLAHAGVTFSVTVDPKVRAEPATGRLIMFLVKEGSKVPPGAEPLRGPFWNDPQPMYGIDVADLPAGEAIIIDDLATSFPARLSELAPGKYRAQARLDIHRTNSEWRRDAGNLSSETVRFTVDASNQVIPITLTKSTTIRTPPTRPGVEVFTLRSELLSEFHAKDVVLRATVVQPAGFDAQKTYAAIYNIPGYGGDHTDGLRRDRAAGVIPGTAEENLIKSSYAIYLDPESPNGHTLFADSANNGPWAKALVTEFIPALEAKYRLIARPEARLLRGHSSGGWSTLWLALTHPETFGATWSSSPDPVDFRRFQVVDIYAQPNFFFAASTVPGKPGAELTSYRTQGEDKMSIRQENLMEEVIGPNNSSAQQWDSWFAVFGPRDAFGRPAALFDPQTGVIDHAVAEQYRAYDICAQLRERPQLLVPIFRDNVRLIVGDRDNFSLNEAVALLKEELARLSPQSPALDAVGYVKILPGFDHGSIFNSPEVRRIPQEMYDHLKRTGVLTP
ncbi:MAG TPA: alpha/beta hydrolase-fold protein [Phycisphaerales bacterium]|nr:alpha/beta hydrolase-fold protein [Phycisphaerales bacterium]